MWCMITEQTEAAKLAQQILSTQGVREVRKSIPFLILVTYFYMEYDVLHEHIYIAMSTNPRSLSWDLSTRRTKPDNGG